MTRPNTLAEVDRWFWPRVRIIPDCCWEWDRPHAGIHGYGRVRVNGRYTLVHRLAYELLVGPIPEELEIDHLCRNRLCVNPGHMEPVTKRVNILRGVGRGAQAARRTHCACGREFDWTDNRGKRGCSVCVRRRAREANRRYRARLRAVS